MNYRSFILILLLLSGCSTLSGLDSKSKFSCKAPDGVSCSSLSGVYANAVEDNLPGLRKSHDQHDAQTQTEKPGNNKVLPTAIPVPPASSAIIGHAPVSGESVYSKQKILRVWLAPWEDADGDLHDHSYFYMVADYGRWLVEHNRQRIIDWYRPTTLKTGQIGKDTSHQEKKVFPGGFSAPTAPSTRSIQNRHSDTSPQQEIYDLEDQF